MVGAWNVATLLVGLVLLELIFGGWTASVRAPSLWRLSIYRDVTWSLPVATLYDGEAVATYRRDVFGLRGAFGQPSDVNVLVVGGSTTDERFITEGETWPDVLAACLAQAGKPVRVANAGVSGQSSRGHILNFDLWLRHIPNLRPQHVLVYLGVNENVLDGRQHSDDVRIFNESARPLWIERLKLNSALYALYKIVDGNLAAYRAGIHHLQAGTQGAENAARALDHGFQRHSQDSLRIGSPEYRLRLEEARVALAGERNAYRDRLTELGQVIDQFGAKAILATQTEGAFRTDAGVVRGNLQRYFALEAINEVTRSYCQETGTLCLDVAREVRINDGDFYDAVHTTPKGSRKVAEAMCHALAREPQFSPRPASADMASPR